MTADLEQLSIGSWESDIAPAPCLDKTLIHGSCRGKPEAALPNIPKKRAASRSPAAHLSPTAAPINKRSSARVKKRRTLVQSCIAKKPSARTEENTLCYENCTNATSPIRNRVSATEVGYTYYNTKDPNSRLMVCRKCQAESQKPGAGRRFIHDRFCVLSKNYLKDPATVREEKKDQKRMADLKKPPARDTKNSSVPMEQTLHRYFAAGPDITPRGEAEVFLSGRTEEWLNQFTNTHYWITKLRVAAKVKYGWDPPRDTWQDAIVLPPGHVHYPFHCLLMLMCSGRVTDLSLIRVFAELFGQYDNLSPQDVLDMEVGVLETYLSPLGLAATRVPQILSTCHTIIDKFKGEVPRNVEGLMQLMGVGAKGAHIMMKEVFGEDTGVGIDCHLVRIFYRLGWSSTEHNVDICRKEVEALFPKVQWGDINRIYAGLGQLIQEDPTRIMNIAIHHVPQVVPALLDLIDMYAEKKNTKNSK
jgi:endonuclease-3